MQNKKTKMSNEFWIVFEIYNDNTVTMERRTSDYPQLSNKFIPHEFT